MKKAILVPAIAITLLGAGLWQVSQVSAMASFNEGNMPPMIAQLVEKLGLDQSQVESALVEIHSEQQQERQAEFASKLDEAVKNGEISGEQKQLILNFHSEQQSKRQEEMDSWRDLSREERQTKMEQRRQVVQDWANQNGIDLSWLVGFGAGGHEGRPEGQGQGAGGEGRGMMGGQGGAGMGMHWEE